MISIHLERLIKVGFVLLIILSLFFLALTVNELKENRFIGGGVPVTNTITVSGEGEVFAVPDIVEFSFSVVEEQKDILRAQEEATKDINEIINFLKENNIDEKDIRTVGYNVHPRYEYKREVVTCFRAPCPPQETRVLVGYEVRQSVTVKVRDIDSAGEMLAGIGVRGATDVSGLNFTIDDKDAHVAEARRLAIMDAQEKAKELARDLGVNLVRVVNFSENSLPQPYFARGFEASLDYIAEESVAIAPDIPVGENQIFSNVFVTYEIR